MGRFIFSIDQDGGPPVRRTCTHDDLETAQIAATRLLADLLREWPERVWGLNPCRIVVSDDTGLMLFSLEILPTLAPAAQAGH
jgi:hypothetical protein